MMADKRKKRMNERFYESLAATGRIAAPAEAASGIHRAASMAMVLFALALAVSGLIPALAPEGRVWNLFLVNGPHNVIHFGTAFLALMATMASTEIARGVWRGLAIFFGIMTLMWLAMGTEMGPVANNAADTWLHLAKTLVFGWLGWSAWNQAESR
jgi:hypothetical protein